MRDTEGLFSNLPFLPTSGNHESNYPLKDFKYFDEFYRTPHYVANNNKNKRYTTLAGRILLIGIN